MALPSKSFYLSSLKCNPRKAKSQPVWCLLYLSNQQELEKAKAGDKTPYTKGISGQANTAKLMSENEKLRKDLRKVLFTLLWRTESKKIIVKAYQWMFSSSYTQRFPRRIKPRPSLGSRFRAVLAFYPLSFAMALIFSIGQNLFRTSLLARSSIVSELTFIVSLFGWGLSVVF